MDERQNCVDCRALAPETETNYTLIGSRYGWRLTKRRDGHGRLAMEWRCPKCWRVYKAAGGEGVASSKSSGELAAVEAPSGTHSVAPPVEDDSPTLVNKGARQKKSTVPPPRRGRAR
jgi:hypothetical protein